MNRREGEASSGALFAQAMAAYQAGRMAEAEALCRGRTGDADALHLRGVIAHRAGRNELAADLIRRAVVLEGRNPSFHHNLGNVLQALGKFADAGASFAAVLALRPDAAEALFALGNLAQIQGRLEEAVAFYERAVACKPGYAEAHNNLGLALLELGRLEAAAAAAERAVSLAPGRARYYRNFAETTRFAPGDPRIAQMEALLASVGLEDQANLHFALGKAFADFSDCHRSFEHLRAGNALRRREIVYDEAATLGLMDRMRATFGAGGPVGGDGSAVPVFIMGMPRSGTSLVEQILASHAQVHGAGEQTILGRAVQRLESAHGAFPECVPLLDLAELGRNYVAELRALAQEATRITDKMPHNFLFAGLVGLALPGARIIHVQRDPVDTCLSCFSKMFSGTHPYAYDLGELGRYWRAYAALMAHWRDILPEGMMLEVRYEDVVADLEGQARRMVAFIGLDWDDACLAFHRTQRVVRTASAAQVRQPVYATSVGRREAYGALLDPLLAALKVA